MPSAPQAASLWSGPERRPTAPVLTELAFLHLLATELLASPNVEEAQATLLRRVREATGATTAALLGIHHGRLRCHLDAIDPAPPGGMPVEREVRLDTEPLALLLTQAVPTILEPGTPRLPWLPATRPPRACLSAPLRRQQKAIGLLVIELPEGADPYAARALLGTAALAAVLGLEAVRREARDEFLAMVRHDIFNPITVALFHTEMLAETLEGRDDKELADLAHSVHSCLNAVCDMISTFCYLEAIDQGAPAIHPEPVDFVELVTDIVDAHRPTATARQLELSFEGDCPALRGDRRQLGRVVANLVSNALKYTPGPGRVDVRLGHDAGGAVLTVSDTGAGLAPADLERLFTKHARFHRHLDIPGTGLGLYLSKAIVEAHGGRIDVESVVGEGSTFRVRIPFA
ncbi:MAG TPA: HAMP domain-containing sensor histidine kinase [Candidatus Limnocylindria bacterium]|nr:HAMP domain-containing sensor histidine kinase [Candidatus Limnocylindria bacterium]